MRKLRHETKDFYHQGGRQRVPWMSFFLNMFWHFSPYFIFCLETHLVTSEILNSHFVSVLLTLGFLIWKLQKILIHFTFFIHFKTVWLSPDTSYSLFPILNFSPEAFPNKDSTEESQPKTNMFQTYKTSFRHVCARVLHNIMQDYQLTCF